MRNFYVTSWSEEVLQEGDAYSNGNPVVQITARWASDIQQAPESADQPIRFGGVIQWTAPRGPNIRPDERNDWLSKMMRTSL